MRFIFKSRCSSGGIGYLLQDIRIHIRGIGHHVGGKDATGISAGDYRCFKIIRRVWAVVVFSVVISPKVPAVCGIFKSFGIIIEWVFFYTINNHLLHKLVRVWKPDVFYHRSFPVLHCDVVYIIAIWKTDGIAVARNIYEVAICVSAPGLIERDKGITRYRRRFSRLIKPVCKGKGVRIRDGFVHYPPAECNVFLLFTRKDDFSQQVGGRYKFRGQLYMCVRIADTTVIIPEIVYYAILIGNLETMYIGWG